MAKEEKSFPSPHFTDVLGMTLRDYFAAKAMQAIMENEEFMEKINNRVERKMTNSQLIAHLSYIQANAMLNERENEQ